MDQEGIDNLDGEAKKRLRQMSRELALSPIWHDWSGRGTGPNVDYPSEDPLPLEFEETLGTGASGDVEKIVCHNISLAVKTKTVRLGQLREWKEIDVLKKLSHRHIIKFVGTFNHKQVMGLVLWPVAVCDLATFFRDLDIFKDNETLRSFSKSFPEPIHHFRELGIKVESCALAKLLAKEWLYQKFGCLASAIYYIHRNGIRHKDLKPSNILLTPSGIRLADFGTSTDFSDRPSSESNNGERGTQIYFAPEVAAHEISGRPADIFMLGCVFLEMCWSICMSKKTIKDLAIVRSGPFQANLSAVRRQCLDCIEDASADPRVTTLQHLLLLIREMLDPDPGKRPNALKIKSQLVYFDGCRKKDNEKGDSEWSFHGRCCQPVQIGTKPITKAGINDLKKFMDERGQPVALLSIPNDHPANVVAAQPSSALPPQVHIDPPSERQPEDTSYEAREQNPFIRGDAAAQAVNQSSPYSPRIKDQAQVSVQEMAAESSADDTPRTNTKPKDMLPHISDTTEEEAWEAMRADFFKRELAIGKIDRELCDQAWQAGRRRRLDRFYTYGPVVKATPEQPREMGQAEVALHPRAAAELGVYKTREAQEGWRDGGHGGVRLDGEGSAGSELQLGQVVPSIEQEGGSNRSLECGLKRKQVDAAKTDEEPDSGCRFTDVDIRRYIHRQLS